MTFNFEFSLGFLESAGRESLGRNVVQLSVRRFQDYRYGIPENS